jgi:type II secretory pathway component PulJ
MRNPVAERWRDERGTSVIEVSVASLLLALVLSVVLPLLTGMQSDVNQAQDRSSTNDEASIALAQLQNDIHGANVIDAPTALGGLTGAALSLFTQSGGPPYHCVQYQVTGGELQRRGRVSGTGVAWGSTWATIATGVTNGASNTPPFAQSTDLQTIAVRILVNKGSSVTPLDVNTSITGRNITSYDTPFSSGYCG